MQRKLGREDYYTFQKAKVGVKLNQARDMAATVRAEPSARFRKMVDEINCSNDVNVRNTV